MRRKSLKGIGLFLGTLTYIMVVAGCGSSSGSYKATDYAPESAYDMEDSAAGSALYERDYDVAEEEMATESSEGAEAEEITEEKSNNQSKRKLITNMNMKAETKEFDKTLDFIKKRTDELGGYVESFSSETSSYRDERTANLTLRIPEEKLDGFVNEVAKESNITSQDMDVTDVTLKYADLESHRNALRAEESQLLTLMERAETIEDIMLIQDKLTDVRYQLESMESQLRTYDNQISYSTLRITLHEVIEYTPEPIKNPTFAERAKEGFEENLASVITFFTELALLLITHIPVLIILLVMLVVIIIIIRIADKKHKKRLASRPPVKPPVYPQGPVNYGPPMGQAPTYGPTYGPAPGPATGTGVNQPPQNADMNAGSISNNKDVNSENNNTSNDDKK